MDSTYDFDDFFEHKTLDEIHGEPDTKSLQKLFKQLKRNARSMASTLGGDQYSHLFMLSNGPTYQGLHQFNHKEILEFLPSEEEQQRRKLLYNKKDMMVTRRNTK